MTARGEPRHSVTTADLLRRRLPVRAVHNPTGRSQPCVDSSLGVRPDYRPSSNIVARCPLPRRPKPSLRREPYRSSRSFRPCRSSRLRRFPPPDDLRVCCTPQPDLGFAMFRTPLPKQKRRPRWRPPFEAFPSSAAGVATPYPLVVRPEPCCHVSHPDLRVFNPPMNPLRPPRSCLHGAARCFLGLASLRMCPRSPAVGEKRTAHRWGARRGSSLGVRYPEVLGS